MRESFAEALVALREQEGISQSEVARQSRMSQTMICRYETGDRLPKRSAVDKLVGGRLERVRLYIAAGFIPNSPVMRAVVAQKLASETTVRKVRNKTLTFVGDSEAGHPQRVPCQREDPHYPHFSTVYKTSECG
jgi:transcriptional regulator with XRE-family HTH domain